LVRGTTQLIRAALRNDLPRVRQLVQLGAPLELADTRHLLSALHWACRVGFERVAEALLDGKYEGHGAGINSVVAGGWTPLMLAGGWTPLMLASYYGREGVVRLLLARGARQELQSSNGFAVLHWAVSFNEPGVVAILCGAAGAAAALALRDGSGRTPLALAIYLHYAACGAVLRAHGATA
jgi:ankyrin repeat protein